jgi:serine/threonine-protein kinase RsbW
MCARVPARIPADPPAGPEKVGVVTAGQPNGTSVESGNEVRIAIPASLEFVRIVRLTASGLASRLGFDVEEIDNLRIAVDELAGAVVDASGTGELEVTFSDREGELRIEGHAPAANGQPLAIDDLTAQILNSVCDKYELRVDANTARFSCVVRLPQL